MKLNFNILCYALIGLAWITSVFSQRFNQRPAQQYNCVTPDNYYGYCVLLSYCPQIANIFQTTNRRVAEQYVIGLQRSCGTRNVNGDPVVCCTRPQQQQQQQNIRPTTNPVTQAPNPFFPTGRPITQAPITQAPITQPPTTTTTTTQRPVTSAPLIEPKGTYCRGPDIREGSCIELKDCQELVNELYAKQTDQTFANFLRASNVICGGTGSIVCCPTGTSQQIRTTATPRVNSNEIPTRLPTVTEGCGYTASSYKKIVGGEVSKKGAWPWIALLGYNDELSSSPFKCGGTLITARHVITAAHCIRSDLSFVRLGEHDLSSDTETKTVDIPIVKQEVNADYNKRNGHSDIALLYLERNVEFNDFISPICLPNTPALRQKSYVSSTPFVAGWGKTMEGGTSAKILQELQIPIYKNDVCRQSYANEKRLFTDNQFDNAVICAGVLSGGKDTCQGDSGGPLMIPEPYQDNVRYYLIGIVSYGIGCARPNIPGVYTSTQYFMDWINEMVANTP